MFLCISVGHSKLFDKSHKFITLVNFIHFYSGKICMNIWRKIHVHTHAYEFIQLYYDFHSVSKIQNNLTYKYMFTKPSHLPKYCYWFEIAFRRNNFWFVIMIIYLINPKSIYQFY